jgi:hypothetical protein
MSKSKHLFLLAFLFVVVVVGCKKDNDNNDDNTPTPTTGTLIFQGTDHVPTKMISPYLKLLTHNLKVADTIKMITLNYMVNATEIWVSKTKVEAGQPDTMTWYKIGDNDTLRYVEDYAFAPVTLPSGEYKSIKILLKNICYRLAAYMQDTSQVILMKESMGSYADPCDYDGLVPTNYFSADGNHNLDTISNTFVLVSPGEHINGFTINPGGTTRIYWKLGGEGDYDPYQGHFDWFDENNNGAWDCGVDGMDNFVVPPGMTCMWGFIVEYD